MGTHLPDRLCLISLKKNQKNASRLPDTASVCQCLPGSPRAPKSTKISVSQAWEALTGSASSDVFLLLFFREKLLAMEYFDHLKAVAKIKIKRVN